MSILAKILGATPAAVHFPGGDNVEYGKKQTARAVATAVLASILLAVAAPSKAAEAAPRLMEPRPTLAAVASEKVEALSNESLAAAVQAAPPAQTADSGGFFKSGKGKAALVMLVAATGLTVYSKYHDRVKSVIR